LPSSLGGSRSSCHSEPDFDSGTITGSRSILTCPRELIQEVGTLAAPNQRPSRLSPRKITGGNPSDSTHSRSGDAPKDHRRSNARPNRPSGTVAFPKDKHEHFTITLCPCFFARTRFLGSTRTVGQVRPEEEKSHYPDFSPGPTWVGRQRCPSSTIARKFRIGI
jgi:hypothetical protein